MSLGEGQESGLTNREHEVAEAYASGQSYKEIARTLGVSPTTVRTHLRTVYSKLGVTSKIQLARHLDASSVPEDTGADTATVAELALELDDAVRRERSLAKVLRIISQQGGDLEAVIDEVLDHALEICEAEFGILFEYQGDFIVRELRSRGISPAFDAWLKEVGSFRVEPTTGVGLATGKLKPVSIADVRAGGLYESGSPLRVATMDFGKARSLAAIPMMSGGQLIGVFTVYRTRVHPFNERALELVQLFADQAAIAIENIRQFQQLQTRLDREAVNKEILRVISESPDDEQPVFDFILQSACRLCEADVGAFVLGHEGGGPQRMVATTDVTDRTLALYADGEFTMEAGRSNAADAILQRKVIQVEDLSQHPLYKSGDPRIRYLVDEQGIRTNLYVPLISKGRGIGCLILWRREVRPYTPDQIDLVETFAAQAVIAIENVRQFREIQLRLARAQANREILEVIRTSRDDEQPVFQAIARNAVDLCAAQFCMLWRYEGMQVHYCASHGFTEAFMAEYLVNYPMPPETNGIVYQVIQSGRTVHLPDAHDDSYGDAEVARQHGYKYMLGVPIDTDEGIWGVMVLAWSVGQTPEAAQVELLETYAAQAVIAINNARQFRELQTRLEHAQATRKILQVISDSRDDEAPVFDAILERACDLCNAPLAYLSMATEDRTKVVSPARLGAFAKFGETLDNLRVSLGGSELALARAINECRVFREDDIADSPIYRGGEPNRVSMVEDEGARSLLVVPLIRDGEGIGSITLYRRLVLPFSDNDVALVESFAAQAVIAINNVRQFRELQARLDRERGTAEILKLLSRSREDEAPVFDLILRKAAELCGADAAALSFGREGDPHQRLVAERGVHPMTQQHYRDGNVGMNPETSFAANAICNGVPVHVEDFAESDGYRQGDVAMRSLVDDTGMRTSLFVPLLSRNRGIGALILFRREVRPYTADEISLVETFATQAVLAVENVEQFRALQALNSELEQRVDTQVTEIERMGRFKRFLSPAVADALANSGDESVLASHRALIATLFCDIRGFTAFCEVAEPEETIEVLQAYHEEMGKLISAHGGGVDKRMGDGIMVIFNDPLPCDDPAGDAVRLAVAMRARMVDLCKGWKRLGHRLGFGVGISLGYATIGMVGSEGRYDYTASGTAVNMAARLCDRAEDGEILLSPRAYTAVEDEMSAESSGEIELKGLREPVEVFRLSGT